MMFRTLAFLVLGAAMPALASAGVRASSEGTDSEGQKLSASRAFDGLLSTGWAEGEDDSGPGSWLEVSLDQMTDVQTVSIWPGKIDQGKRGLRQYGRPHTVTITLMGGDEEVKKVARVLDIADTGPVRLDIPIVGNARKVRITMDEVYGGGIRSDTYITEVAINFATAATHPKVAAFHTWRASEAGEKQRLEFDTEVAEWTATLKEADFGERETFDQLKRAASDGSPKEIERVRRSVPDGYRVAAVPPSRAALNALLQLNDPNAIGPLVLAKTRSTGQMAAKLGDRVSRFEALADLKGGNKRNVRPFGESGFCKGCLRSFGEPLSVAVDNFGGVWVSDTANNRVQQFGFDGIVRSTVGEGAPGISNSWLGAKRDWYASALAPSTSQGAFTLPVATTVLPDAKNGDGLLVLDAAGRITRTNGKGDVLKAWKLPVTTPLSPRVGGDGHIATAKNKVMVTWGSEGFLYSLSGTELARFTFEQGPVRGLVAFKNGKIGAVIGDDVALYNPTDGFRYKTLVADTLPGGFEDLAIALDEAGKLWVVTDTGTALKYKKPGVIDYQVDFATYSLEVPRFDVYQDVLFVTHDDKLEKHDALQLHQKADAP